MQQIMSTEKSFMIKKKNIHYLLVTLLLLLPLPRASAKSDFYNQIDGLDIFYFVCGLILFLVLVYTGCAGCWSSCCKKLRSVPVTETTHGGLPLSTAPHLHNHNFITATGGGGGLDSKVIKTFPVFVYPDVKNLRKIDTEETDAVIDCAVCLSEFEDGDVLRQLPRCLHAFHAVCIDGWFVSHSTCPVCRSDLKSIVSETALNDGVVIDVLEEDEGEGDHPSMETQTSSETEDQTHVSISMVENSEDVNDSINTGSEFPRSHSTGHSLSQLGLDNCERNNLPDDDVKTDFACGKLNNSCLASSAGG